MSDIESAHSSYKLFCRIDEYISVRILQTQLLMRRYFFTSMVIIQLAKLIVRAAGPLMESRSFSNQVCDNVTYTVPLRAACPVRYHILLFCQVRMPVSKFNLFSPNAYDEEIGRKLAQIEANTNKISKLIYKDNSNGK